MITDLTDRLHQAVGVSAETQLDLVSTLLVVGLLWLGRKLVLRAALRKTDDAHTRYQWRKSTAYVAFLIGAVVAARIWFQGLGSLTTIIGLLSAGLAIALKDPLVNLAGWLFIVWRRPFEVGDRIEVGGVAGDVIDLRIFQFTLMEIGNWVHADQSTGRVIHVPNGKVFTDALANYSKGFQYIWDEVAVLVTFESNWEKAKEILREIATRHAEHLSGTAERRVREASMKFMIFYSKLTPIVYTSVEDCGVLLTLRYLTEPQERRGRLEAIWEDVLRAFAEQDDIDFAYPTRRFFFNAAEGKPGAGKRPEADTRPFVPPGPNHPFDG
ncbi:MAG: mechanosensitive ion channel [Candidatus Latescibacterota bacterium]|jgi:small-conductance mechanosensitive channel